jgi:hypothetical protein
MIDQRKTINVLLSLERLFWRLATIMESFICLIGQELTRFGGGRRGPKLLSHREIYATNLFKHWSKLGRGGATSGIYIGRVGRYNSSRSLRIGQGEEVLR